MRLPTSLFLLCAVAIFGCSSESRPSAQDSGEAAKGEAGAAGIGGGGIAGAGAAGETATAGAAGGSGSGGGLFGGAAGAAGKPGGGTGGSKGGAPVGGPGDYSKLQCDSPYRDHYPPGFFKNNSCASGTSPCPPSEVCCQYLCIMGGAPCANINDPQAWENCSTNVACALAQDCEIGGIIPALGAGGGSNQGAGGAPSGGAAGAPAGGSPNGGAGGDAGYAGQGGP